MNDERATRDGRWPPSRSMTTRTQVDRLEPGMSLAIAEVQRRSSQTGQRPGYGRCGVT